MSTHFDRETLLAAFDEIASAAIEAHARLDIALFGGSALMLASNFRFSTEDADIGELTEPWPDWLSAAVQRIGTSNGWSAHWLNDAVQSHLSPLARADRDMVAFGTFPRRSDRVGITIFVPTARYMLALKLKALRVASPAKGAQDYADVANLLRVLDIQEVERAVEILSEYFPRSGADADKQRFVLRHILAAGRSQDAPRYPRPSD
jgi:hypothetical protein